MKGMKLLVLLILCGGLFFTCAQKEEINDLMTQNRDGLVYKINQAKPFTGKVIAYYENGLKRIEATYQSGKKNGAFTEWYENGQAKFEGNFNNDLPTGLLVHWNSAGEKLYEHTFTGGLRSEPANLSDVDVAIMIDIFDMHHEIMNPTAKGFAHNYTKNNDVIADDATGLMWQYDGTASDVTYDGAVRYINELNKKKFSGYSDWRLPTLDEVMTLMEPEPVHGDLFIDPIFDKTQRWLWTSDRVKDKPYRWIVRLAHGDCPNNGIVTNFSVRAVRTGGMEG